MTRLTVALWQMSPTRRDPAANLDRLGGAAARAAEAGARLLITPELSLTGYDVGDLDGIASCDHIERVAALASRHDIAIVCGLAVPDPAGAGRHRNVSVMVDRSGEVQETYVKAHLFGDLDRDRFVAGDRPFGLATLDGVRVATVICYDVEFPESVRAAALAGADFVAVPTANMKPYAIVNDAVIRVRAWESQLYVGYANHHGVEAGTQYVGGSLLVAPDGAVLAQAGDAEDLIFAELDTDAVRTARNANPYLSQRRPELYAAQESDAGDE